MQAARPSAHAATIQSVSGKPVRCRCTDPNAAHAHTRMHTHTGALHPKNNCRRQNCLWKEESHKVLIHEKRLPSETAVSSWKKEGDREVF